MAEKKKAKKSSSKKGRYDGVKLALEKQKSVLLAEAGETISTGIHTGNEAFPDVTDQAAAEADQNFSLRLREREQKLLKKIEEAIDRIDDGTFGICDSCGGEIGLKRLEARPVTTLCIDCKTEQEEEEKLRETG
ncbi:MAG TPA: RNA polymerase-binding protein DksA [Nitrospiria bacterium]